MYVVLRIPEPTLAGIAFAMTGFGFGKTAQLGCVIPSNSRPRKGAFVTKSPTMQASGDQPPRDVPKVHQQEIVLGRWCGDCTMCCKVLGILELKKPQMEWCSHCNIGIGCKIYDRRPAECQKYFCTYLLDDQLGEHWKPSKAKMVLSFQQHPNRITVHVDPGRKDAWRKEPYYSQIKAWAAAAVPHGGQVNVWQGHDVIAVLPDGEKNLGPVRRDQLIINNETRGPLGIEIDAMVVDEDDPILAQLPRPKVG